MGNGVLHLDFETRSVVDLRISGVHKYAEHPSTKILCTGFAFGEEEPQLALWDDLPFRVRKHIENGDPVVAHNAAFELVIWNLVGTLRYGWPKLYIGSLSCTMARAMAMCLPAQLGQLAVALGLDDRKDDVGRRIMLELSTPQYDREGNAFWVNDPEKFKRLYQYCPQDVIVERAADKRLLGLSPTERRVWAFDQQVNWRGMLVDRASAASAQKMAFAEQMRLNGELQAVTKNEVASHNSHIQLGKWLEKHGLKTDGVDKNAVALLLARSDLPAHVRRALEIRKEAAKSSTAKYKALLDGASADGRLRGVFQAYGAGTGRWAGRRFQPHNLPRTSKGDPEIIRQAFEQFPFDGAGLENIRKLGAPMTILSKCLRGMIIAPPGKDLIGMDFSSIEARKLAWLAGELRALEIFRTHGKIYEDAAASVFGVLMSSIGEDDFERQVGKVCVLSLGFQGGVGAFFQMARTYNVDMAVALPSLWERADEDDRLRAQEKWENPKVHKPLGISKPVWFASELTKVNWRRNNPSIVQYWRDVESAAIAATNREGSITKAGAAGRQVQFLKRGSFLFCRLPSGRSLCYPYPQIRDVETPWGEKRAALKYMGEDKGRWTRFTAYGGLLVENITQASSRDLLAEAMLRCEDHGYPIVLHVHDEAVAEVNEGWGSVEEMAGIMTELPAWAAGMPIAAKGWRGKRYQK